MAPRPPSVARAFVSGVPDTADPTKVGSQKWNAPLTVDLGSVLTPFSNLNTGADLLAYFSAVDQVTLTALTAFARSIIAAVDAPSVRAVIGAVARGGDAMTGSLDFAGLYSATGLRTPSLPNDAANKAYVDALATLVSGALVFKGAWDASTGVFPGAGAAQTGWFYKVSVAGTVGGQTFSAGDDIYAVTNNASTTVYANNWLVIQGTLTLAEVQAAVGFTFGTLAAQSSVTASQISDASANGRSLITAANYAAMLALLGLETGTARGDAIYTILSTDSFVYTNAALTASRAWTLPAANSVNQGHRVFIADMAAGVTATNTIVLSRTGADTLTVAGTAGNTTCTLDTAGIMAIAISDGVSKWLVSRHAPYGTGAGQTVRLDSNSKLPAVDGSQLTNLTTGLSHGQCQLSLLDSGHVILKPRDGNRLLVNGVQCSVPSAGVSLVVTGLTVSTLYYIYATASAGTVNALEASTTVHATDATTGVEIKSGDATRTLVGMVRPITGPAFADSDALRFVRSWFNDRGVAFLGPNTNSNGTVSTTWADSTFKAEFLGWNGENVSVTIAGNCTHNTAGGIPQAAIGFNSTTAPAQAGTFSMFEAPSANYVGNVAVAYTTRLAADGYNFATLLWQTNTGTAAFNSSVSGMTAGRHG